MPDNPSTALQPPPIEKLGESLLALLAARNADPFGILGPHPFQTPQGRRWVVRFFQPRAIEGQILLGTTLA